MIKLRNLFLIVLLLLLVACADSSAKSDSTGAKENVNIDFSLFSTENDIFSVLFREWAERIEEETDGRVTFTPYYSGQLSSLYETLDAVKNGTVDGGTLSAGAVSGDIDSMSLLEPIGVFENEENFQGFYEDASSLMNEIFNNEGIELTFWTPGTTQMFILNSDTILKNAEQFQGLKFRTAGRWQAEQIKLLGASPMNMDPGELYLALQNNTVDGTIQTVNLTEASKLHEVAPEISLMQAPSNANIFVINSDVWERISEEDQEIIKTISDEVGMGSFAYGLEKENELVESMIEDGAEVYELTEEEKGALLKELGQVVPEIVDSIGEEGKELYEIKKQYQ